MELGDMHTVTGGAALYPQVGVRHTLGVRVTCVVRACLLTYLLTYLPTYLLTYLPTYLPTSYLPTYLPSYLPAYLLTHLLTYLSLPYPQLWALTDATDGARAEEPISLGTNPQTQPQPQPQPQP